MKKFISLLLFVLFSNNIFSQTKLDTLLFDKVNSYRHSLGLKKVKWDANVYKMAKHHSVYQSKTEKITHIETTDVDSLTELKEMQDRYAFYVNKKEDYLSEICAGYLCFNMEISIEKIADTLFKSWLNSEEHRKIIKDKEPVFGACSVIIKKGGIKENNVILYDSIPPLNGSVPLTPKMKKHLQKMKNNGVNITKMKLYIASVDDKSDKKEVMWISATFNFYKPK